MPRRRQQLNARSLPESSNGSVVMDDDDDSSPVNELLSEVRRRNDWYTEANVLNGLTHHTIGLAAEEKEIVVPVKVTKKRVHKPSGLQSAVVKPKRKQTAKQRAKKLEKEIRKLQEQPNPLWAKAPFKRIVREIAAANEVTFGRVRMKVSALEALREGAQAFMDDFFMRVNDMAIHGKRVTIKHEDMLLACSYYSLEQEFRHAVNEGKERFEKLKLEARAQLMDA